MTPDHSETEEVEIRLRQCTKELHEMADEVAAAKQVKEFIGDMKRNVLAKYTAQYSGLPSTKSQEQARTNPSFLEEMNGLASQYQAAESAILRWQATLASFEAARSLLSFSRESLRQL